MPGPISHNPAEIHQIIKKNAQDENNRPQAKEIIKAKLLQELKASAADLDEYLSQYEIDYLSFSELTAKEIENNILDKPVLKSGTWPSVFEIHKISRKSQTVIDGYKKLGLTETDYSSLRTILNKMPNINKATCGERSAFLRMKNCPVWPLENNKFAHALGNEYTQTLTPVKRSLKQNYKHSLPRDHNDLLPPPTTRRHAMPVQPTTQALIFEFPKKSSTLSTSIPFGILGEPSPKPNNNFSDFLVHDYQDILQARGLFSNQNYPKDKNKHPSVTQHAEIKIPLQENYNNIKEFKQALRHTTKEDFRAFIEQLHKNNKQILIKGNQNYDIAIEVNLCPAESTTFIYKEKTINWYHLSCYQVDHRTTNKLVAYMRLFPDPNAILTQDSNINVGELCKLQKSPYISGSFALKNLVKPITKALALPELILLDEATLEIEYTGPIIPGSSEIDKRTATVLLLLAHAIAYNKTWYEGYKFGLKRGTNMPLSPNPFCQYTLTQNYATRANALGTLSSMSMQEIKELIIPIDSSAFATLLSAFKLTDTNTLQQALFTILETEKIARWNNEAPPIYPTSSLAGFYDMLFQRTICWDLPALIRIPMKDIASGKKIDILLPEWQQVLLTKILRVPNHMYAIQSTRAEKKIYYIYISTAKIFYITRFADLDAEKQQNIIELFLTEPYKIKIAYDQELEQIAVHTKYKFAVFNSKIPNLLEKYGEDKLLEMYNRQYGKTATTNDTGFFKYKRFFNTLNTITSYSLFSYKPKQTAKQQIQSNSAEKELENTKSNESGPKLLAG